MLIRPQLKENIQAGNSATNQNHLEVRRPVQVQSDAVLRRSLIRKLSENTLYWLYVIILCIRKMTFYIVLSLTHMFKKSFSNKLFMVTNTGTTVVFTE